MRSLHESVKIRNAGKSVAQVGETDQSCRNRDPIQYIGCKMAYLTAFRHAFPSLPSVRVWLPPSRHHFSSLSSLRFWLEPSRHTGELHVTRHMTMGAEDVFALSSLHINEREIAGVRVSQHVSTPLTPHTRQVFGGAHHLFVAPSTCRPRPRAGVLSVKTDANDQADDNASKMTAMEEKLARWRAQAEELRLKDKDSAVSRARASQTLLPDLDKVSNEADEGLGDELIGGPRGTARRTVVDRMRDLKISERRAELSADVQKFREQEEMSAAERGERAKALDAERQRLKKEIEEDAAKWAEKKNAYWKAGLDSRLDVPQEL